MSDLTTLIVEDEAIMAMDLQRRLCKLGYEESVVKGSSDAALKYLEIHNPNLILCDINIHGVKDGIDVAEYVMEHKYYGRYVDDFVIVHDDKEYLKRLKGIIRTFLKVDLRLDIHPKKIYLQHYTKGVPFLGTFIKPNRICIGKRTKGNFFKAILRQNEITKKCKPTIEEQVKFQSSMDSYLGIMKHYDTYRLRKKMLWKHLSPYWWNVVYLSGGYAKFVRKVRRSTASNTV